MHLEDIVNSAIETAECYRWYWSKIFPEGHTGNGSQCHKGQVIWTENGKATGPEVTNPSETLCGTHTMMFCISDARHRAKDCNISQSSFSSFFGSIPTFCTTTPHFWNENVYSGDIYILKVNL